MNISPYLPFVFSQPAWQNTHQYTHLLSSSLSNFRAYIFVWLMVFVADSLSVLFLDWWSRCVFAVRPWGMWRASISRSSPCVFGNSLRLLSLDWLTLFPPLSFAHPLSQAPILLCCSTFVAPSSVWCVLFAFRFGFSSLPHSTFSNLFSIASNRLLALLSVLVLCLSPSLNYCCDHSFASLVTMWFAASLFAVYRIDIYGSIFLSLLPLERPLRAWDNSMQSHQIS